MHEPNHSSGLVRRQEQGTKQRHIIQIEPHRLWIIKILNKFNIISKDVCANLLEEYLVSVKRNIVKTDISKESEEESDSYLVRLEPTKWKDQDHYLVLGLQNLRYKSGDDDIRRAHRRKALKHHPDKRGKTQTDLESDYYACITRAMDILGDPIKRRSFDSVDPTFDDTVPGPIKAQKLTEDPHIFYRTFGPFFELNSRWSVKPNVPSLGDHSTSRDKVEAFYEFWYNLQSWREFSYLDEEDKEKGENRDERRWLDRQNKQARQQRKKAENQRIRQLIDNAYSCDPRIMRFKDEDKKKKLDMKKAKQDEIKQRYEREEAERLQREEVEKQKKLQAEEEDKRKKLEDKKQREQAKKEMKKATKGLTEVFKENDYFATNPREKIRHIEDLDKITRMLNTLEILEFKNEIENCQDNSVRRNLFLKRVDGINKTLEEEKRQSSSSNSNDIKSVKTPDKTKPWTEDEIKLLVKSVSLFPAGTKDRWEVIANYMTDHSPNKIQRDSKEVLTKVKQIQDQLAKRARS